MQKKMPTIDPALKGEYAFNIWDMVFFSGLDLN